MMDPREKTIQLLKQQAVARHFDPDLADCCPDEEEFEPYGPDAYLGDHFPVTLTGQGRSQLEFEEELSEDEYEIYRQT